MRRPFFRLRVIRAEDDVGFFQEKMLIPPRMLLVSMVLGSVAPRRTAMMVPGWCRDGETSVVMEDA